MADDWRGRLFEEHSDLHRKIEKLKKFMLSEEFRQIPEVDQIDMTEQLSHMQKYHQVLMRRVSRQCNNA